MILLYATIFSVFVPALPLLAQAPQQGLPSSSTATYRFQEFVVSASRVQENILRSPVSIERVSTKDFQRSAQPSVFDALETVKGVQIITPSLGFKVFNTRGFANTTNVRSTQLVDGVDNQAPHIGAPIASAFMPSDLDVERVEIIPGAASVLYGMNAINGLVHIFTKNPFLFEGLDIQQRTGVNHIGDSLSPPQLFSETSVRVAIACGSQFAAKVGFTYTRGYDWIPNDRTDLFTQGNRSLSLFDADNPARDPVNSYGNESANRRTLSLEGKNVIVARTGYDEREVANYNLNTLRGDVSIHFKPAPELECSYTFRGSLTNTVYQRSNRFQLLDYGLTQHVVQVRGADFFITAYRTGENTGKSFNLRSMAENIDKAYKSDNVWFADFQRNFSAQRSQGKSLAEALRLARSSADAGRPQSGDRTFDSLRTALGDINNWDIGAALRVRSALYHIEGQVEISKGLLTWLKDALELDVSAGFSYRRYEIMPDGNYFINPTTSDQTQALPYSKAGGFLEAARNFFEGKLRTSVALSIDKADYFSLRSNPRLAVVFSPEEQHSFRLSFQSGYRYPSIFEAFSNVNSGGVKRVGGLPVMSSGVFENSYLRTSIDAFQAAVNEGINRLGARAQDSLIAANSHLLIKNTYTYLQPEFIRSFEIGYKGFFFGDHLFVDADAYYNLTSSFIAQIEANVPLTSAADSIPSALFNRSRQQRYRLWTNSKTNVNNFGASLGARWNDESGWFASANATFAQLDNTSQADGLEDGFNTPRWMLNASAGNDALVRNFGFAFSAHWQSGFYWQSFLVNGDVPSYWTLDAQLSYTPDKNWRLKLGGTNIVNKQYVSFLGGPSIGAMVYFNVHYRLPID